MMLGSLIQCLIHLALQATLVIVVVLITQAAIVVITEGAVVAAADSWFVIQFGLYFGDLLLQVLAVRLVQLRQFVVFECLFEPAFLHQLRTTFYCRPASLRSDGE